MASISPKAKYDYQVDLAVENNSHTQMIRRIPKGGDILELGCATGYMSLLMRDELNCHVVGVDYDASAASKAEAFCEEVIVADVEQLQWLDKLGERRFDAITCADIIEHLRDPEVVLKALLPYLKPNGKLMVSVPNGVHTSIRLEILEGRLTYEETGLLDSTHLHFYTHASLRGLLSRAGYAVEELTYTFQDVPDNIIRERLVRVGIEPSERILNLLHSPEAVAFQFVVVASPAAPDMAIEPYSELHDLPLRDSLEYTRNLLKELEETRKNLQDRNKRLEEYHHHSIALQEIVQHHEQTIKEHEAHSERITVAHTEQSVELKKIQDALQSEHVRLRDLEVLNDKLTEDLETNSRTLQAVLNSQGWRLWNRLILPRRIVRRLMLYVTFILRKPRLGFSSFWQYLQILRRGGFEELRQKLGVAQQETTDALAFNRSYDRWITRFDNFNAVRLDRLREVAQAMTDPPLISILMPVYNVSEVWLREALESIMAQAYPYWELCAIDDASPRPEVRRVLEEYAAKDKRIKLKFREHNGHISNASNDALAMAKGDYVALMDHDDTIPPQALYFIAREIQYHPETAIIYSDEDKLNPEGRRVCPYFKSSYNPDLMLSQNMICHFGVYRRDLVQSVGGFREGLEGAQDYDLALRIIERIKHRQIRHIPRVLYHWRVIPESTASGAAAKPYALKAGIRAVSEYLEHKGEKAEVMESPLIEGMIRVRYALPEPAPLVSIIIPTRNGLALVKQCVTSIVERTTYPNYEILIVDNNSDDLEALDYFEQLENAETARILRYPKPFNFSRINNFAVTHAKGELLVLMNNDIEVITPDWLTEMASHAMRQEIGAVGARLWYPNDTLQHGGVVLGLGGVAGHAMKYLPRGHRGYFGRAVLIQNYSAVTAACLAVRKEVYEKVDGLNENDLTVAFNDVDFCLRIQEKGYRNLWTPHAELYHHESASRGQEDTPEKQARFLGECDYMQNRWGELLINDPAYSPNLSRLSEDFSLNWHDPWSDRVGDF